MDNAVEVDCGPVGDRTRHRKRVSSPSVDVLQDDSEVSPNKAKAMCGSDRSLTTEPSDDCSNETHMIFSQYEVVRTILSCLPLQDLRSAAQVCSSWNSIAKIIFQSRTKVEWLFGSPSQSLEEILKTKFYSDPKLCIMFVTRMKKSLQFMHSHIGPACVTLQVQGSGVVGTETSELNVEEIEGSSRLVVSALLMPSIPGVTFRTFELPTSRLQKIKRQVDLTPEELLELTSINPDEEVKCLLLFCSSFSHKLERIISSIQSRQRHRFVVGGAVCSEKRDVIFGVALSGPNLGVASMILPNNVTKKSEAEKYFEKFRKDTSSIKAKQSVCFTFACVGRGKMMYGEPNVESGLFRKYFPSTPLVGFFGFGEIGCDLVPDTPADASALPSTSDEFEDHFLHDFCSVFVYLGFS